MDTVVHRYFFWKIVEHYALKKQFRVLALYNTQVWLEDDTVKPRRVIRIVLSEVDWANRLKRDIGHAKQQFNTIYKQLGVWEIQGENVYVMSLPPVDSWEETMEPFTIGNRKGKIRNIALHTDTDTYNEITEQTLENDGLPPFEPLDSHEAMEQEILRIHENVKRTTVGRQTKERQTLFFGKPRVIYALLISILIMYSVLEANGGSTNIETLIDFGAKYNPLIVEGEWWRLFSAMFLHIGFFHLLMNGMALYFLGSAVEQLFGSIRFLVIYFMAGLFGSAVSFAFTDSLSAGASGALFGCFGALLYFGIKQPSLFFRTLGRSVIVLLIINFFLGFIVPGIDIGAHGGGLVGGFLAAAAVRMPKETRKTNVLWSLSALAGYIVLAASLLFFGYQSAAGTVNPDMAALEANRLFQQGNWEEARPLVAEGLEQDSEHVELLFLQAYLDMQDGKDKAAQEKLEFVTSENRHFHQAWFNLALIYWQQGEIEQAQQAVEEAIKQGEQDEHPDVEIDRYREVQEEIEQQQH